MREVCFQQDLQSVDDRLGERPSRGQPVRRRLNTHLRFDGIEAGDPTQSLVRQRRIRGLHNLIQLASYMGPPGGEHDVASCRQPLEAGIAIDVQHSLEVFQMRYPAVPPSVRREDVDRRGWRRSAPWPLVTRIDPKPPGLRSSAAWIEDRHWRVVGEQMIGGEHVLAQAIVQRLEPPARAADPAGESRALQFDTVAGEDLRLPIERSVVAVFADQHLGEQRGVPRPPAIGLSGMGAWVTVLHVRQAYFGRVMRSTRSWAGTQSSIC